jgi:hypothetical protein
MIAKGTTHNNGAKLASYMTTGKDGERAELWQLRGFEAANIKDAFRDVHIMADATKCEQPFFHVQVRNPEGEALNRQQWEYTTDRIERMLGLTVQPRAIAFHIDEQTGHEHMHVAWSRIDETTLTAKELPFFKDRLKKISRELELHFGLTVVTNSREGPIKYGATKAEEQQAQRLGFDKEAVRNTIRHCWDISDCGRGFDTALAQAGLILAKGDRGHGNFLVIDPKGGLHVLGKRILDASASQVRERLSDLDRNNLPNVAQARTLMLDLPRDRIDRLTRELAEVQKQIKAEREYANRDPVQDQIAWEDALAKAAIEKEKIEREFAETPGAPVRERQSGGLLADAAHEASRDARTEQMYGPAAEVWEAWCQTDLDKLIGAALKGKRVSFKPPGKEAFAAALDQHGITFARATNTEAERSHRHAAFAREVGNYAPHFREGEIVIITEPGLEYRRAGEAITPRRVHKLDQSLAEKFVKALDIGDKLQGIYASLKASEKRAPQRVADREAIREVYAESSGHRSRTIAAEKTIRKGAAATKDAIHTSAAALGKAASVASSIGKTLDVIGGMVESLAAPQVTPERRQEADKAKFVREAQAEDHVEFSRYSAEEAHQHQTRENDQVGRDTRLRAGQREPERER